MHAAITKMQPIWNTQVHQSSLTKLRLVKMMPPGCVSIVQGLAAFSFWTVPVSYLPYYLYSKLTCSPIHFHPLLQHLPLQNILHLQLFLHYVMVLRDTFCHSLSYPSCSFPISQVRHWVHQPWKQLERWCWDKGDGCIQHWPRYRDAAAEPWAELQQWWHYLPNWQHHELHHPVEVDVRLTRDAQVLLDMWPNSLRLVKEDMGIKKMCSI